MAASTANVDIISVAEAKTLDGLFAERVRRTPEAIAYREFREREGRWFDITWRDVNREVARWQRALEKDGVVAGDRVVGIVRRPDPVPCESCAAGEWDMCRNQLYFERGIKELDGYAAEQVRIEAAFTVKVNRSLGLLGVLLEPASVVVKAWDHVYRIGERSRSWRPRRIGLG